MTKIKHAHETRYPSPLKQQTLSKEEKIKIIKDRFYDIMEALGLDMEDESLQKTPLRVAKMYVNEMFSGLDPHTFPDCHLLDEEHVTEAGHHSLILTKCSFISYCEHHFVPMVGTAFVGYIPRGKLIGLSKIHRIVHFFSKRPQLQERLTAQIADSLSLVLESDDVAVSLQAQHFCVMARGARDESGATSTSYFGGVFKSQPTQREEFFLALQRLNG